MTGNLKCLVDYHSKGTAFIKSQLEEMHWDLFRKNYPEKDRSGICLLTTRYPNGYFIEHITYRDLHGVHLTMFSIVFVKVVGKV